MTELSATAERNFRHDDCRNGQFFIQLRQQPSGKNEKLKVFYGTNRNNAYGTNVVQEIYSLCLQDYGPTQIARILTERGIDSPAVWKSKIGVKYSLEKFEAPEIWTTRMVVGILSNPSNL